MSPAARSPMAHVDRTGPGAPGRQRVDDRAGGDRLGEHDASGVGRSVVDDGEGVGDGVAEQHALGSRRLGHRQVGGLDDVDGDGRRVVGTVGITTSAGTDAVLVTEPGAASDGRVAAIVIARDVPAATVSSVQTTSPAASAHCRRIRRSRTRAAGEQVGQHDAGGIGRTGVGHRDGERDAAAGGRRVAVGDLGHGEIGAPRDRRRHRGRRDAVVTAEQRCRRRRHGRVRRRSSPAMPGATVPEIVIRVGGTWVRARSTTRRCRGRT